MSDHPCPTLTGVLEYLISLHREGIRPAEAQARLRHLRQSYPGTTIDLVWEEEVFDCSVHYDALVHLDGQGTVSVSFCPDEELPWPLRGVGRWSDKDLVRVNETLLRVEDAIAFLDFIWDEKPIVNRLLNACLIREILAKDPIELSDAELQRALDAFRRAHKLYTAGDTHRWMERCGMTQDKLEALVADEATVAKLRDRVTSGRVEEYFAAHRADFDTARVARLEFPDEESALWTRDQIRSGGVDFYAEAQHRFLRAAEQSPGLSVELFAVLQRRQASPAHGAAVFAAAPGDLVGPVSTDEGYAVLRVLSITPARLDEPTHQTIKKILFEQWLQEQRQAARIEWYWGNAARTTPANGPPTFAKT
jgi:putative peptide maturation system protein